jgi:hypothetical protein
MSAMTYQLGESMSETTPHPKAVQAEAAAAASRAHRAVLKKIVEQAHDEGIRFIEIAPWNYNTNKPSKEGRMTIAYLVHHRNVVMVSTAICHPDDKFDKVQGRALAASNLMGQRAILLRTPVSKGKSMKEALTNMFTHNVY